MPESICWLIVSDRIWVNLTEKGEKAEREIDFFIRKESDLCDIRNFRKIIPNSFTRHVAPAGKEGSSLREAERRIELTFSDALTFLFLADLSRATSTLLDTKGGSQ